MTWGDTCPGTSADNNSNYKSYGHNLGSHLDYFAAHPSPCPAIDASPPKSGSARQCCAKQDHEACKQDVSLRVMNIPQSRNARQHMPSDYPSALQVRV